MKNKGLFFAVAGSLTFWVTLFAVLKIFHAFPTSWWWVFAPWWIPVSVIGVYFIGMGSYFLIWAWRKERKRQKLNAARLRDRERGIEEVRLRYMWQKEND